MSTTLESRNFDLDWTFDAVSSLAAVEPNLLAKPLDLDDLQLVEFDMPDLQDFAGHLSPMSQGSLQSPTNVTPRSTGFPHNANAFSQYRETHSIAPQRSTQQCMSWDLAGYSPAIPTNACTNPKNNHHLPGRNILGHSINCTELLPDNASVTVVEGVGEMKKVQTKSKSSQAKVFKCRWVGCLEKRNHFRREVELMRHIKTIHVSPQAYQCDECNMFFNRRDNLEAHARRVHQARG
ncbi:hypothetical protein N8T08_000968 [Aspergillus melleus]|uniref:Uncharacterized protein n=1 Tax=Aspergillus melleus TaxID=138277 RepID=A0ACC3BAT4_9EURO|nr:hypothetical protein N8T08_000968 [Aspergillus melleus]